MAKLGRAKDLIPEDYEGMVYTGGDDMPTERMQVKQTKKGVTIDIDMRKIVGLIGAALLALLGFIAQKVWEGVEIAKENKTHREMMAEDIKELRTDVKELRRELYAVYPVISEVAEGANVGTGVE